eukprot:3538205-Amphidinium_carterae.1
MAMIQGATVAVAVAFDVAPASLWYSSSWVASVAAWSLGVADSSRKLPGGAELGFSSLVMIAVAYSKIAVSPWLGSVSMIVALVCNVASVRVASNKSSFTAVVVLLAIVSPSRYADTDHLGWQKAMGSTFDFGSLWVAVRILVPFGGADHLSAGRIMYGLGVLAGVALRSLNILSYFSSTVPGSVWSFDEATGVVSRRFWTAASRSV